MQQQNNICLQHKKQLLFICMDPLCKNIELCSCCVNTNHLSHKKQLFIGFNQSIQKQNQEIQNEVSQVSPSFLSDEINEILSSQQGISFDYEKFENKFNGSASYIRANEQSCIFKDKVTINSIGQLIISEKNVYDIPNKQKISLKLNAFQSCSLIQQLPDDILVTITNRNLLTIYDSADISNLITLKNVYIPLSKSQVTFGNDDLLAYPSYNSIYIINWRSGSLITQIVTKASPIKKIQFMFNAQYISITYKEYKKAPDIHFEIYLVKTQKLVFKTKYSNKLLSIHETDIDQFVVTIGNDIFIYKCFSLQNFIADCKSIYHQNRIGKQQLFILADSQIQILNTNSLERYSIKTMKNLKKWEVIGCFYTQEGEVLILSQNIKQLELQFVI
ncbi:hypothetical protein TTHERM_00440570 (macronuclear) [Tetrahymena thermophila SB210]|uniref:Uncharacterized protein n=1 Tax=Tetrahymena thermophila (strain SB210) TaxID=312017 RepID=I7MK77_TETTS|nr:hypothetical protein TTHERM_00440570 [Tetrahymena thermophila SB210]EAR97606.1 hypothetical protein TTHERM_00440570 [Tetrahymena thermophila SB210]|eukprot:XP_001017851.1 hypothetical protein TTHERM_00440570 [Tetrahymena thermophila SB210]